MKATATLDLINQMLHADQGARYRELLRETMPECEDAYRGEEDPFRSHFGASLAGRECARELWYKFHWTTRPSFDGRMLRLFNRGHLEEGRFIALLRMIGCEVWSHTEDGKQFRVSDHDGHFGGGLDAVVRGFPEYPNDAVLAEFKTHNDKSFTKLLIEGVRAVKFEHYVQMQIYMGKMGLPRAIYFATNKNDDEIHAEWVEFDNATFQRFMERSGMIIRSPQAPKKINESPAWFKCKFCDEAPVCHNGAEPDHNCRTCSYVRLAEEGAWNCTNPVCPGPLDKAQQLAGCSHYEKHGAY